MAPPASSAMGTTPSPASVLADLHMANESEVDLGKVAEQRAQSKDVKNFGKHMVKAHTKMDKDAQAWAKKHHVTVGAPPQDPEHQAEMQKMQDTKQTLLSLSGPEFDKTYMQAMAEDHATDLQKVPTFEQQITDKSLLKLLASAEQGDRLPQEGRRQARPEARRDRFALMPVLARRWAGEGPTRSRPPSAMNCTAIAASSNPITRWKMATPDWPRTRCTSEAPAEQEVARGHGDHDAQDHRRHPRRPATSAP